MKRGEIRELLTKLTIINAKDSLFPIGKKFRSIVEFPGEGLGYLGGYCQPGTKLPPRYMYVREIIAK